MLVIRPYDESMQSARISTLLVNPDLRREHEALQADINVARATLAKALKAQSGSKRDFETEISSAFTARTDQFQVALNRIKDEVAKQADAPYSDVPYDVIFDEKVQGFLETKDFKTAINDYITRYNALLAKSVYFKKGTFTYYDASTIAKQLAEHGFFAAKHSVNLNADTSLEIKTEKELEELIAKEKEAISTDAELRKKFAEIEKLIQKNVAVRDFETYLTNNEGVLARLENVPAFKQDVLKSYLRKHEPLFLTLLEKFQAAEERSKQIRQQADQERTQWEAVIDLFNERFFVPFKLEVSNRISMILGENEIATLGFIFDDGTDSVTVEKKDLLDSLSTGERKALYILNILFEIEARKKAGLETLLIVDDVADSFDYKNKYAIIQYLMDIAESTHFRQILLTHNFDFFRTVQSRFVGYSNCMMVSKTADGIELSQATGIQNVFVRDWKLHFFEDSKKKIASIPFIRNLIEYTRGDADPTFNRLTSLLHWKSDSNQINVSELDGIYNTVFGTNSATQGADRPVIDLIFDEAQACLGAPEGINFENKIVLAIATRLAAERYMIGRINDPAFVAAIEANQTAMLLKKYRELFPTAVQETLVLQRVVLMTPENIHLNSFMYEPILDMSDEHLRRLYSSVLAL